MANRECRMPNADPDARGCDLSSIIRAVGCAKLPFRDCYHIIVFVAQLARELPDRIGSGRTASNRIGSDRTEPNRIDCEREQLLCSLACCCCCCRCCYCIWLLFFALSRVRSDSIAIVGVKSSIRGAPTALGGAGSNEAARPRVRALSCTVHLAAYLTARGVAFSSVLARTRVERSPNKE